MSTERTQGRVTFVENGDANSYALLDESGQWLMSILHNGQQLTAKQVANLRHMAACWNSCGDVPTELLEDVQELGKATIPYRVLERMHRELLDALQQWADAERRNDADELVNARHSRDAAIALASRVTGSAS